MATSSNYTGCIDQCSPVRNRYFYGKMLDVYHFELEQNYFNSKRWLLNRLVSGYGVVCGLNALLGSDLKSLYVTPGVAIDKCGHEIILCKPSAPVALPMPTPPPAQTTGGGQTPPAPQTGNNPQPPGTTATQPAGTPPTAASSTPTAGNGSSSAGAGPENCDCADYYHLMLCYHECPTDPSPSFGGDCDTKATCSPGAIRERYELELAPEKLAAARSTSALAELVSNGTIPYSALATYVSNISLDDPCPDCCIPLANIRVPAYGTPYDASSIDISVRPIVYTNDLLYEMILAIKQGPATTTARKP